MNLYRKLFSSLLVLFLTNSIIFSQFGFQQNEILEFHSYQSFDKIQPEGEIKLAFKVNVFDRWHINSTNQVKII